MRRSRIARSRRPLAGRRIGLRLSLSALAAALAFLGTIAPAAFAAPPETITITDSLSTPHLTIEPGTMVTWINQDPDRHRVRSTSGPASFDSGNLDQGESFSFTFNAEGTYTYADARNDTNLSYFGTVTVVAGGGGGTPPPSGGATVDIVDRSYRPPALTVSAGTEVSWRNLDGNHTVTANDGSFDSGIFDTGTYRRTFNTPGTYSYFCTLHPEMQGTITVNGTDGTPPPEPPPTTPPPTTPPPPPPPGDVSIFDNGFTPRSKTVTTGTTIVWSNTGALPHTVTATTSGFDSGLVMASETYRRTFNTPGTYSYFCTLHPEMQGTITVNGTATGEPDTGDVDRGDGERAPSVDPSDDPSSTPPAASSNTGAIIDAAIIDLDYDPRDLTVDAGVIIRWTNIGDLPHTVTDRDAAFDSGILLTGGTFELVLADIGTYEYFCTLHPDMIGTITVVEAGDRIGAAGADSIMAAASPPPTADVTNQFAAAITVSLMVAAAGLLGGLGMLARTLLSDEGDSSV